jgi:fructan beta-fructosidase
MISRMFSLLIGAILLMLAQTPQKQVLPRTSGGPWRLQYHFSPPQNWTNDPNGLVYYKGEYHLFYQFNPFGSKWGHMSWGHAVSADLLHWHDLPVALEEENGIMIFSGSAVVDEHNSSGLCSKNGGDVSCLIAIYTGHTPERQTQNIAFSNDRGRTWTKYKGNPVIDLHLKNFRDPKVLWYEAGKKWVMVTALSDQHKLRLFESHDLIHWNALSDFGPAGAVEGVWECPDLFELPLTGTDETRWVLVLNMNPGGIAGGSGTQYFVGQFDGSKFTNENPTSKQLWMDYGKDYYAAVSFFGGKTGEARRVMIGWFSNWQYANQTPETDWRGAMALPREITLAKSDEGIRVRQQPVREIAGLQKALTTAAVVPAQNSALIDMAAANLELQQATRDGDQMELEVEFELGSATRFGVQVFRGGDHKTEVGIDRSRGKLYVDRTHSGVTSFSKDFPGRQEAPLRVDGAAKLMIFLDHSSIEVFANDGAVTIADRVYPDAQDIGLAFFADRPAPRIRLRMWRVASVWGDVKTLPHGAEVIPAKN